MFIKQFMLSLVTIVYLINPETVFENTTYVYFSN